MNDNEKIQRAEQLIAEANALLSEVKANSSDEEDVIAKYKNDYCKGKKHYIGDDGCVSWIVASIACTFENISNPYRYYLTKELAEQAKKLKDFNDKLLAFKYCYDLDYEPDWSDSHEDKYYVYYSKTDHRYDVNSLSIWDIHNVYFSSEEVAQKCADWLNSLGD